jgi:hypothetical protein
MRVLCESPNRHRVFRVFPQARQAVGVYGPRVILEFENVRDRRRPEQTTEPIIAAG